MKPTIITHRYVQCPGCGEHEFRIDHLTAPAEFGPWRCDEYGCCTEISGTIAADGQVEIEHHRAAPSGLALLKLGDLYLVVDEASHIEDEYADYFYHSHQCPLNLMRSVVAVFDATGPDPHGQLRLIANIESSPEARERLEHVSSLAGLFGLFATDGQPASSSWPEENGGMLPQVAELHRRGSGQA